MNFTVHPLTPDLWPALEDLFGENGAVGGCWCMYWRIGRAYRERPREENRAAFREVVKRGPPPGLLAFDGDMAVGWCQLTPRDALPWLDRTWRLKRADDVPLVALVLLRAQRLSQAGRLVRADRGGGESCAQGKGPGARSLSSRCGADAERFGHRLCLDLRAGRVQDGRPPRAAAPDHAPRSKLKGVSG